ncbi:hypothetical protein ACJJTC_014251 [Scirpophaga incertulas]
MTSLTKVDNKQFSRKFGMTASQQRVTRSIPCQRQRRFLSLLSSILIVPVSKASPDQKRHKRRFKTWTGTMIDYEDSGNCAAVVNLRLPGTRASRPPVWLIDITCRRIVQNLRANVLVERLHD